MFNTNLASSINNFASLMLPLSQVDLERNWKWKDHDEEGIRFAFFVTIQELRQLAVEIASHRTPPTPAQKILGQYHAQYMDLQASIFGLAEADANIVPAEGEWPVRQVYSHILRTDIGFSGVIRYALEKHRAGMWTAEQMSDEDEMRMIGMTEDEYKSLTGGTFEGMLAYHQEFHPRVIQEFCTITDSELDLPSTFWEETRFPIHHRLHRYEAHAIQHTVQIDKTLAAINHAPGETQRLIRYLFAALAEVDANLIGINHAPEGCVKLANSINSRKDEIQTLLEV